MATQKVRPDQDRDERQQTQRRQVSRTITFGSLAIAAIVGAIVVLIGIVAMGAGEQITTPAAVSTIGSGGTEAKASPSETPYTNRFSTGFKGIPPRDAKPSEPMRGELVTSFGGIHPWSTPDWSATYLYADGRLIWAKGLVANGPAASSWMEQRLTPEGVHLLRSQPDLSRMNTPWFPESAWERREPRPYVPSRYAVVGWMAQQGLDADSLVSLLPARAGKLLSEGNPIAGPGFEVTTADARALAAILNDAGFRRTSSGDTSLGVVAYSNSVTIGIDIFHHDETLVMEFHPVLPDGQVPSFRVK